MMTILMVKVHVIIMILKLNFTVAGILREKKFYSKPMECYASAYIQCIN